MDCARSGEMPSERSVLRERRRATWCKIMTALSHLAPWFSGTIIVGYFVILAVIGLPISSVFRRAASG